ncbi:MAG: hypothetical protein IIA66_01620 [Planctomycetes bacterium]|nr:hypothetical protein [Planctomycetota bacterium]
MLAYSLWESIFRIPQLPIIMGCLIPITAIIGSFWYKAQKNKHDHDLKRTMLERGMSAEEIERVISAGVQDDEK